MSLDNVLAVGALAHGQIELLVAGLLLSMLLLFVASALIARIIERVPLLMDVAALVLAWTAANLVVDDTPWSTSSAQRMTFPDQWAAVSPPDLRRADPAGRSLHSPGHCAAPTCRTRAETSRE